VSVAHLAGAELPTRFGAFRCELFEEDGAEHLALIHGDPGRATFVHVHQACPAAERFGSLLCDCAARLDDALGRLGAAESGVLVYLRGDESELVTGLEACVPAAAQAILRALGTSAQLAPAAVGRVGGGEVQIDQRGVHDALNCRGSHQAF
jgi:hypothetical protein